MKSALTFNQFIKDNPFKKKMLIVPNYTVGEQYIRQANDQGIPCINLECKTIYDLASGICQVQTALDGEVLKLINQDVATNLMMDIMQDQLQQLRYFVNPEWIDIPTASELIHQIDEIRIMDAQDVLKTKADSPKLIDLMMILEAYENRLKQDSLVDYVSLLKMAIDLVNNEAGFKNSKFGILANTNAIGLERALITAFAGADIEIIQTPRIEGIDQPETFYSRVSESFEEGNDLVRIYGVESQPIQQPAVDFFRSYGQVNEFKYVAQDILEKGYAFGDVQVVFSHYSYALLLHNVAQSIGLNLSLPGGIPGYHSEIYAFIRDLFIFVRNGYFEEDLKTVLHNRSLKLATTKKSNRRLFEDFKIEGVGFGRSRYQKVIEKYKAFQDSEDETERDYFAFGEFLSNLLSLFPEDLSQAVKLKGFTLGVAGFLSDYCTKDNLNGDYQRECQQAVTGLIEFAEFSTIEMTAGSIMDQIQVLIEALSVQSNREAEDAILCTSFSTAGLITRPYVYVIGLDADRFPLKANESPVLLDQERQNLGLTFGMSTSVEKNSIYRLLESLAGKIKRVVFGYNYFDTVGIKEKNASSFYNRLLEIQQVDKKSLAKSGFIGTSKNILQEKEYYLFATKAQSEQPTMAIIKRQGYVLGDQIKASDQGLGSLSASSMMIFIDCPRKYFYHYRSRLMPPEIAEYDRSIWLDAQKKGIFMHKVLEDYVATIIIANKEKEFKPTAFADRFEKNCQAMLEMVPYLSRSTYEMQRHRCQEDARGCLIQLCDEMKTQHFVPIATELAFGMNQTDPIEIGLNDGSTVSLRGSIDRVDVLKDGTYRIVDYKTGKFTNMKKKREQGVDVLIQDYLYAIVLEKIFDDQSSMVTESRYDFPCDRNAHLVTAINRTSKMAVMDTLNAIAGDIRSGNYGRCCGDPAKYPNWETTCSYCDYGTLCQAEACAWEV